MKTTRRIATLLLALALLLSLSVTAFAAENEGTTTQTKLIVTGDQLQGKKVYATRMFTAHWVDSNSNGLIDDKDKVGYTLDKEWEGLFWAGTGSTVPSGKIDVSSQEGVNIGDKALAYVRTLKDNDTDKGLVEFAKKAAAYKAQTSISNTAEATGDASNTATFEELTAGYYLVQPDKGSTSVDRKTDAMLVNVPSEKAATLRLKSEYPSVEKKIDTNKTESNAQIGEKVSFTLTSKVPDMTDYDTYYFAFKDTMSKGLTFNSDVKVTIGEQELAADAFKVTTADGTDGAHEITIEILNMKTDGTAKYTAGADIKVTYSATLNKDAVVGTTPSNTNSAKVEYQNGPDVNNHGTSNPSTTTTRTYEIKVQKHDFDDNNKDSYLAGAKFALSTSETAPTFTKGEGGSYTLGTDGANKAANDAVIPLMGADATGYRVAEKNEDGAVNYFTTVGTSATTINGLKAGTYYLHEIEAPEGYNKLTAPVKVTITETKDETTDKVTGVTYTVDEKAQDTNDTVKIENKTGSMLPSTGGMGTIGLTALGVGVVAFGVLAPRKKKEQQ